MLYIYIKIKTIEWALPKQKNSQQKKHPGISRCILFKYLSYQNVELWREPTHVSQTRT